jgi:hypothetical protein
MTVVPAPIPRNEVRQVRPSLADFTVLVTATLIVMGPLRSPRRVIAAFMGARQQGRPVDGTKGTDSTKSPPPPDA